MSISESTDFLKLYRGTEESITDLIHTAVENGNVYFAYDDDSTIAKTDITPGKLYFDANEHRFVVSGGGDIAFIKAHPTGEIQKNIDDNYIFHRSEIDARKITVDNVLITDKNVLYRVVGFSDEDPNIVYAQIIAGGGGILSNPMKTSWDGGQKPPTRLISTKPIECEIVLSTTDDSINAGSVTVSLNDIVVPVASKSFIDLSGGKVNYKITINPSNFILDQENTLKIQLAALDDNPDHVTTSVFKIHIFTSEFVPKEDKWNPRVPFGTDSAVTKQINYEYIFTHLNNDVAGVIKVYIDEDEIKTIRTYGDGIITINCNDYDYSHGSHKLRFDGFVEIQEELFAVSSYTYDIIWATPEGGTAPIIISNYTNEVEENYNIIRIPYIVYAKNQTNIKIQQYINATELAPQTITYDSTLATWQIWSISKYIPESDNSFRIVADVDGVTTTKIFNVYIARSELVLDPESDQLLLYLTALDRSNNETNKTRSTWTFTNFNGTTYNAKFNNFNWYNDGWQLDNEGTNVLRLNNGASVEIPFTDILQSDNAGQGFTIELEFKCRNAINFAKLMSYTAISTQAKDEFGNLLYQQIPVYESDGVTPVMTPVLDFNNNPVAKTDSTNHPLYSYQLPDTTTIELALHVDENGNKTYYLDNELYANENGDPIVPNDGALTALYEMTQVMTDALDDNGNKIPLLVENGAVEKRIIYKDGKVANAVGSFFNNGIGICIGTQEAFFASSGKKVNVRYADDNKVKVSVVVDTTTHLMYIYINAVLSGVERFGNSDHFNANATSLVFNSDYCDLDIYNIRIYNRPLNFDGIVQNWIGDAPNLITKRQRYLENHITKKDPRNSYITLDYELTKKLSAQMAQNYKEQLLQNNHDAQPGLPIMVISTYPTHLSQDTKSDLLPYNKAIKQFVDIRFWDPNGTIPLDGKGAVGFKIQDTELSVQGTSSQGYPRRNFKLKIKATDSQVNTYANKFPFYFTTWDGDDSKKDIWPTPVYTDDMDAAAIEEETARAWEEYTTETQGYKQLKKIDIGNGTQETKFCFKADYMESSSTHNTSLANYIDFLSIKDINNTYNFVHPMKRIEGFGDKSYRQTVYGFPMLVFWDHKGTNTPPEFVGRYNFNIDKGATGAFGFDLDVEHPILKDVDYLAPKVNAKGKNVKDSIGNLIPEIKHGNPKIGEICECWELTSNQHGFTGFRRNDWDAKDANGKLDFYNFWENRYHIMNFDPSDVYKGDPSSNKATAINNLMLYAKNIMDLSKWIYSTDVHPWDTDDETALSHHKLTQVINLNNIQYTIDPDNPEAVILKHHYYTKNSDGLTVTEVGPERFKIIYSDINDRSTGILHVYDTDLTTELPTVSLYEDEINALLDEPVFYPTRDTEVNTSKTYYYAPDDEHPIPTEWYYTVNEYLKNANNELVKNIDGEYIVVRTIIKIIDSDTSREYNLADIYEKYTTDNKDYRLSKYHAEFNQHLNFDFCALYFILTEFFILYDSREKNMMIATWGPESGSNGNYIWYPIFYDMDTQLGINNSGTVFWDYDVNAQDEGLFSGAGSVLWDNFYACFLPQIKDVYIAMRGRFSLENCLKYYNTDSADRWSPIMKNVDAFYKYVAPSIDADGLRYVTKQGTEAITPQYFYCAQGDRSLNRAAFFRNRFNYKDSEWLGGDYRTQGGQAIEMRYDANWTGTSDPDVAFKNDPNKEALRAELDSNATFDIKPYLTQYCSVYYDEIPCEGGRFDIQQEPVVENGVPTEATKVKYAKNIDHIKKSGYITVDPLESIQREIDKGSALSQQFVYLYGPAYIRDLGDLSLKYLDRLFCDSAIRLNRLVIGNDNPNYFNNGLTDDAFNLDTAYYTTTQTLNPNAKALLEYLDLSNLGGLTGSLDLSGCLKLKTIKALGTKYNTITIPDGNVIESIYLPSTTTVLVQRQSQKLNKVIRTKSEAIDYGNPNGGASVGLYIENITDRMNISLAYENDIVNEYMTNGSEDTHKANVMQLMSDNIPAGSPSYYINLSVLNIEGGQLGLTSYEILDYVVKQKIKMRYDNNLVGDTSYAKDLKVRLLDVDWSPYKKISIDAEDDRQYTDNQYFIRNDNLTYSPLPADTSFEYANANLGGIYLKTNNRLRRNGNVDTSELEGLPNLNLLKMFIQDYNNKGRTNTDATNLYLVKDIQETTDKTKFLPHIGGEIFIDNAITDPIDEYELYQIAQTYTSQLAPDDTPLTICASHVNNACRAKFVEIKDGVEETIQIYRTNAAGVGSKVFPSKVINNLTRSHYDFRGWISKTDAESAGDPELFSNGQINIANNGVVDVNSPVLNYSIVPNKTDENFVNGNTLLSDLTFTENGETYYAIYTIHNYNITYVLDPAAYEANPTDPTTHEVKLVISGYAIASNPATTIPYKIDDSLPLAKGWIFKGWGYKNDNQVRNLNNIYADKDLVLYPIFAVDNVYNNPIPESNLEYYIEPTNNEAYIRRVLVKYGGKICFPATVTDPATQRQCPVVSILNNLPEANGSQPKGSTVPSVYAANEYGITVQSGATKTDGSSNNLAENNAITHIFFQGNNIKEFGSNAFYLMLNLQHIDLPNSLLYIGDRCFNRCIRLQISSLTTVKSIGAQAFIRTNLPRFERDGDNITGVDNVTDLVIDSPNLTLIGTNAFGYSGWRNIRIGSNNNPYRAQLNNYFWPSPYTVDITTGTEGLVDETYYCVKNITIYSTRYTNTNELPTSGIMTNRSTYTGGNKTVFNIQYVEQV